MNTLGAIGLLFLVAILGFLGWRYASPFIRRSYTLPHEETDHE